MAKLIELDGAALPVSKILCVAQNYRDHAREMGSPVPPEPVFFLKPPSALLCGGGEIQLPSRSTRVEVETELAVIVGKRGRDLSLGAAWDVVLGYAVFFDITARDLQAEARHLGLPWTESKGFVTFAPVSSAVSAALVSDPHALPIRLHVSGKLRQASSTSQMVFKIPELLVAASRIMTLEPGDILATGTPAGVCPILPGDLLRAEITGVGQLDCTVGRRES